MWPTPEEAARLREERIQIHSDIYNNIIPKRVPIACNLPKYLIAEYAGVDIFEFQYHLDLIHDAALELSSKLNTDVAPYAPAQQIGDRPVGFFQLLKSQSFVLGNNGVVQHPEVTAMNDDEYDELIQRPYKFLVDTVVPRQYKGIDWSKPVETVRNIEMAKDFLQTAVEQTLPAFLEVMEKGGFYPGAPATGMGMTEAPFDFLADQLRSFSGSMMDVRRHRNKCIEACDALLPLLFETGMPAEPHPLGTIFIPLHMPTYMREKDFVEVWLPSFQKMMEQYAARSARISPFLENDWDRYLDIVHDTFPAGSVLWVEKGDPKLVKEKLGDKFIIQGMFPVSTMKQGTKQECIDETKKFLDIMMPGGNYIFNFDKLPMSLSDVNLENWFAICDTVREYGVYDNAGEKANGQLLNSENFAVDNSIELDYSDGYMFDFGIFKEENPLVPDSAKEDMMSYMKKMLTFYMMLLM